MFSTASMIHGMANQRPGSSTVKKVNEHSRSPSPVVSRRHRRSYTISAPLGTRVNAFPSPLGLPPTPPRTTSPVLGKENSPPLRPTSSNSAPLLATNKKGKESDSSPATPKCPRIFHTTSIFNDRFLDLPPLPETWTTQHDRAICVLDSRNYSHAAIVSKLRRVFPELRGTLTPLMIDKRLRILDQNVELDYWRLSSRAISTPQGASHSTRDHAAEATPTKSPKGNRFMDFVMGKHSSPRAATNNLGMGVKGYLERL